MKEKIYTIPINEVYEQDFECPLCVLEKRLEKEQVEYCSGPAMMEPDHRIESNEKGYCKHHFEMMFKDSEKLPFALVLESYLDCFLKEYLEYDGKIKEDANQKKALFSKNTHKDEIYKELLLSIQNKQNSCMICERIEKTMQRYIEVMIDMWKEEEEFKNKFASSKGVCIPHMIKLLDTATKKLKAKNKEEFIKVLYNIQKEQLKYLYDDVHKFTLKFDYRNKDMPWGTAKDSPVRAVEKLAGYTIIRENNP